MKQQIVKMSVMTSLAILPFLIACKGPDYQDTPCGRQTSTRDECLSINNPSLSASGFVSAMNKVNVSTDAYGEVIFNKSYVEKFADETLRKQVEGKDDWFVIWDDKAKNHKAVSLQYIRALSYYDMNQYNYETDEYGSYYELDWASDNDRGDHRIYEEFLKTSPDGSNYEVVTYDSSSGLFNGTQTKYSYEDEVETSDVLLLSASKQEKQFFNKAAYVSLAYNLNIQSSLSLVSLAESTERLMNKNNGRLTVQDQAAFASGLTSIAGVSGLEIVKALSDKESKAELLDKISERIGTSPAVLENKILPELLSIHL